MKITREDVLYVAELAHLQLIDAEIEKFGGQLNEILAYIDKLNELDVSAIEPMAQVLTSETHPEAALREDVLRPCDISVQILEQAPEARAPYFRVPRVIGK